MGAFDSKTKIGAFQTQGEVSAPAPSPVRQEHTIEIHGQGKSANYIVIARTLVSEADEIWVTEKLITLFSNARKRVSSSEQLQLADDLWLQKLIISWSLPIPLEPDRAKAIASLGQTDRDYLYAAIMAAQEPREQRSMSLGRQRGPSPAMQDALKERAKRLNKQIPKKRVPWYNNR